MTPDTPTIAMATPADNSLLIASSPLPPSLMTFTTSSYLLTIANAKGEQLAILHPDGKVTLSHQGAEDEAARVFWRAIESYGVGIIARVRELERRLAVYETVEPFPL